MPPKGQASGHSRRNGGNEQQYLNRTKGEGETFKHKRLRRGKRAGGKKSIQGDTGDRSGSSGKVSENSGPKHDPPQKIFTCEICGSENFTEKNLASHFTGKKHTYKMRCFSQKFLSFAMDNVHQVTVGSSYLVKLKDSTEGMKCRCRLCHANITSPRLLMDHFTGLKHRYRYLKVKYLPLFKSLIDNTTHHERPTVILDMARDIEEKEGHPVDLDDDPGDVEDNLNELEEDIYKHVKVKNVETAGKSESPDDQTENSEETEARQVKDVDSMDKSESAGGHSQTEENMDNEERETKQKVTGDSVDVSAIPDDGSHIKESEETRPQEKVKDVESMDMPETPGDECRMEESDETETKQKVKGDSVEVLAIPDDGSHIEESEETGPQEKGKDVESMDMPETPGDECQTEEGDETETKQKVKGDSMEVSEFPDDQSQIEKSEEAEPQQKVKDADSVNMPEAPGDECQTEESKETKAKQEPLIYVKGLPLDYTCESLWKMFDPIGSNTHKIKITMTPPLPSNSDRKAAYLRMDSVEACEELITKYNHSCLPGTVQKITMVPAWKSGVAKNDKHELIITSLYISNLLTNVTREDLQFIFSPHGWVTSVVRTAKTGCYQVYMESGEQCDKVIAAFNGKSLPGCSDILNVKPCRNLTSLCESDYQGAILHISNLPPKYDKMKLVEMCQPYNKDKITNMQMYMSKGGTGSETAFMEMDSEEGCKRIIQDHDGKCAQGSSWRMSIKLHEVIKKPKPNVSEKVQAEKKKMNYSVIVYGIPSNFKSQDFREALQPHKDEMDVNVVEAIHRQHTSTGFVNLASLEACNRFVQKYDGQILAGTHNKMRVKIQPKEDIAKDTPLVALPCKIFVGGLSLRTKKETLKKHFSRWGEVADVVLISPDHADDKTSLGFGFIKYTKPGMVDAALNAGPHMIDGRKVDTKRRYLKEKHNIRDIKILGLPYGFTTHQLKEIFKADKGVNDFKVLPAKPRPIGFVNLTSYDVCTEFVRKHNNRYHPEIGEHLFVKFSPKEETPANLYDPMPPPTPMRGPSMSRPTLPPPGNNFPKHPYYSRPPIPGMDFHTLNQSKQAWPSRSQTYSMSIDQTNMMKTKPQNVSVESQKSLLAKLVEQLNQKKSTFPPRSVPEKQSQSLNNQIMQAERQELKRKLDHLRAGPTTLETERKMELPISMQHSFVRGSRPAYQASLDDKSHLLADAKRVEEILEEQLRRKEHELQIAKKLKLLEEANLRHEKLRKELGQPNRNSQILEDANKKTEFLKKEIMRKEMQLRRQSGEQANSQEELQKTEYQRKRQKMDDRVSSTTQAKMGKTDISMGSNYPTDLQANDPVQGLLIQAIVNELRKENSEVVQRMLDFIADLPEDCLQVLADLSIPALQSFCGVNLIQLQQMSAAIPQIDRLIRSIDLDNLIALIQAIGAEAFHSLASQFSRNRSLLFHVRHLFNMLNG